MKTIGQACKNQSKPLKWQPANLSNKSKKYTKSEKHKQNG